VTDIQKQECWSLVLSPLWGSPALTAYPRARALGSSLAPLRGCLKFEVASGSSAARDTFGFAGRKQAYDSAQVFPGSLVQGGISADQVADHVPGSQVERTFRRRPHGEGNRTLRAETDTLRRRFLPRPDPDGLREHVYRDGFVADFDLPVATQTKQVFQGFPSWQRLPVRTKIVSLPVIGCKYAEGFPESGQASSTWQLAISTWQLALGNWHLANCQLLIAKCR